MNSVSLVPIHTPLVKPGDDLVGVILASLHESLVDDDILVIAETVVATAEDRVVALSSVTPSEKAREYAEKYMMEPELAQLVIQESDTILGGIPSLLLSIRNGMLLANAGIDHSNSPEGTVVLLPKDPMESARRIRREILKRTGRKLGVLIADSRTQPLRMGVVGVAVGVAGFDPIHDVRGKKDLFGRPLRVTRRALADDLASAAELLMGEAAEGIPVVKIRNAPVTISETKWTSQDLAISSEECLYMKIFNEWRRNSTETHNKTTNSKP